MKRYTQEGRLADVITLISLLSVDVHAFRTISNLNDALRGKPQSSENWEDIANKHPEFFRFNGKRDCIALLIRSYFAEDLKGHRQVLSVIETQKLIDTAISLHDKEILLKQKNGYLYSFIGSLIVAVIAVSGVIFSTVYSNRSNNIVLQKIDSLNTKIQRIEHKMIK
ncbi:hypothetical protein [Mucilaginibacter sp.]|uniref:hypothetical protein n=1 Tax=Mucilaginibacter sp. TaxID=1882438 RepID=UPI00261AA61E|nr:hypothetical protein [Mucilaginibacter sp.]MDB5125963.1 hypothetical protein [Mucilaginibacter sp.]